MFLLVTDFGELTRCSDEAGGDSAILIADFRGSRTCLNDTQLSGIPGGPPAAGRRGGLWSGGVRDTPDVPIDPPATARVVSALSALLLSAGGCEPVCSGGR